MKATKHIIESIEVDGEIVYAVKKQDIIDIQQEQLERHHKPLLRPEAFAMLVAKCDEENERVLNDEDATWDDVFRGQSMDNYLSNVVTPEMRKRAINEDTAQWEARQLLTERLRDVANDLDDGAHTLETALWAVEFHNIPVECVTPLDFIHAIHEANQASLDSRIQNEHDTYPDKYRTQADIDERIAFFESKRTNIEALKDALKKELNK